MSDPLSEIQALSSKRVSIRDKLKKRREALETILSQSSTLTSETSDKSDANGSKSSSADTKLRDILTDPSKVSTTEESPKVASVSPEEETNSKPVSSPAESTDPPPPKKRYSQNQDDERKSSDDLLSLLSSQSAKEKADQQQRDEIMELLSKPSVKEQSLMDTFKSQSGGGVKEFCNHSTKEECMKLNSSRKPCDKLHFRKIIQPHTDESLGDCSFLNTCFHMDTCKYIHYEVDADDIRQSSAKKAEAAQPIVRSRHLLETMKLVPPQWVQCDLRNFELSVLGKFSVVMADPPWDIHMELPYGTMSDDEMRRLRVPDLQDDGLIFLWVTGRAMELGRQCLKLWGYDRVDEIIWVKTNQLQRIIRTGRTGHWLNHGKEHCLVGLKGNLKMNRGLDSDVIVAEVRATSHKPDEIYGIIERLTPGTRKIELFGRPHNAQPNWVTLGNQLDGVVIHDEEMLDRWNETYPNGYDIVPGMVLHPRKEP